MHIPDKGVRFFVQSQAPLLQSVAEQFGLQFPTGSSFSSRGPAGEDRRLDQEAFHSFLAWVAGKIGAPEDPRIFRRLLNPHYSVPSSEFADTHVSKAFWRIAGDVVTTVGQANRIRSLNPLYARVFLDEDTQSVGALAQILADPIGAREYVHRDYLFERDFGGVDQLYPDRQSEELPADFGGLTSWHRRAVLRVLQDSDLAFLDNDDNRFLETTEDGLVVEFQRVLSAEQYASSVPTLSTSIWTPIHALREAASTLGYSLDYPFYLYDVSVRTQPDRQPLPKKEQECPYYLYCTPYYQTLLFSVLGSGTAEDEEAKPSWYSGVSRAKDQIFEKIRRQRATLKDLE